MVTAVVTKATSALKCARKVLCSNYGSVGILCSGGAVTAKPDVRPACCPEQPKANLRLVHFVGNKSSCRVSINL